MRTAAKKPAAWRRWLSIGLRCGHLAGVVMLGAALHGASLEPGIGAVSVLLSGIGLLAVEWADARIRFAELAGVVALLKLGAIAWLVTDHAGAQALFWLVLVVSGLVSHAPRAVRHWRPDRLRRG
jgi:hypothetical protein